MMKNFKGKAIYNPSGKAAEYAPWACNFYVGCSNGCTYCYCKKGILAGTMGMDKPQLKKCFKDETHALKVFERELLTNIVELKKHGLFFSFTTDPMLPETFDMTRRAIDLCIAFKVPVKVLTKVDRSEDILRWYGSKWVTTDIRRLIAFGFTLTGHDELEPGASTNAERIAAMKDLHNAGFRTWASIEPMIDTWSSMHIIGLTLDFCALYKVGIESGKKYSKVNLNDFVHTVSKYLKSEKGNSAKIYFKDSLLKSASIDRADLPSNCVSRDYNIFI